LWLVIDQLYDLTLSLGIVNRFVNQKFTKGWLPNFDLVEVLEVSIVFHLEDISLIIFLLDLDLSFVMLLAAIPDAVLVINLEAGH
jgi:hypothetical protein